ncbi:MAG TPA: class I SAM-dependent methyltransferase [Gemmatimonadales bacterium]|nr:class I SAM-dependent methyltransferase [Gemmatimonadales bacterium]
MRLEAGRRIGYRERAWFYRIEEPNTADRAFLSQLVTRDVRSILEIPCGAGRNFDWLSRTKRRIVLVDKEPRMVEQVAGRIRALSRPARIRTLVADMRSLVLRERFDLIIVPQEAFQLIPRRDALGALRRLRSHLTRRGRLVVDVAVFDPAAIRDRSACPGYYDPGIPDERLVPEWTRRLPEGGSLARSRTQRHSRRRLTVEFRYTVKQAHRAEQRLRTVLHLQRYTREELVGLARRAGLGCRAVYGSHSGQPYQEGSGRMILILGHE